MQVKVKKEVLFNLLKNYLNENRTFNNPSGNFIHSFDRNEMPIGPSPHMSTQLSVERPPVEDENYVPASIGELRAAAARISEEVPPDQVESFYRSLHRLLDRSIDNSENKMIAEAYWLEDEEGRKTSDDLSYNSSSSSSYSEVGDLKSLKQDKDFITAKSRIQKDPYYDLTNVKKKGQYVNIIQMLSDKHGVEYSVIEALLYNKASGDGDGDEDEDSGRLSTGFASSTPSASTPSAYYSKVKAAPLTDEDLEEDDEDYIEKTLGRIDKKSKNIADIDADLDRVTPKYKVLGQDYWNKAYDNLLAGKVSPLTSVSQVVIDSMDAVSRIIGTEVSVKFGYGGEEVASSYVGSPEEKAWKGVLSNGINTNHEVVYKLPADQKTKDFWKERVVKFINKFQTGQAGSLSGFTEEFIKLASTAYDMFENQSGLSLADFVSKVANRVTDSILNDPVYGANTRNTTQSSAEFLKKTIDTGFSYQIKKKPFGIPNRTLFLSRDLNPEDLIMHAGEEKTMRQALVDAVVAYVIVKSNEFQKEKKQLDKDLASEARDEAIQKIIASVAGGEKFNYSSGTGDNKSTFTISKQQIIEDVSSFVDQQFIEAESNQKAIESEDLDETEEFLEDPTKTPKEKKLKFNYEVAAQIMRATDSIANFRNYFDRVLVKKFQGALKALDNLDDFKGESTANYITIFNDTLSEIIPSVEESLKDIVKKGESEGLTSDDLKLHKEAIAQVKGIRKFVYGTTTRGGSQTIQNLDNGFISFDGNKYNALDFFSDGDNVGPAILRQIVSDLIGTKLKGALKSVKTIDFKFEKKVIRQAEAVEEVLRKEILSYFSGINLKEAQNAANLTGQQLGMPETKTIFLEPNMKEVQLKTIYPFVGRVKKMPDWDKMNPAAKNYVAWFTAIADKRVGGASSMDERVKVAKELYDKLMRIATGEIDEASKDVKETIAKTEKVIDAMMSEVEVVEEFTKEQTKRIIKDPSLMKYIVTQAMSMYLEDLENPVDVSNYK